MFSPAQQAPYRPFVDAAWKSHAASRGLDPKDKEARAAWYSAELKNAIGLTSTRAADKGFHFDLAIAHFEGLADNGSFYWRGKLRESILERIRYSSKCPDATADECERIARQSLQLDYTPKLETLNKANFITIIRALKIASNRRR